MGVYVCVCAGKKNTCDPGTVSQGPLSFIFSALVFSLVLTSIPRGSFAYQGRGSKLSGLECVFIVSKEIQLGPRTDDGHPSGGGSVRGEGWRSGLGVEIHQD